MLGAGCWILLDLCLSPGASADVFSTVGAVQSRVVACLKGDDSSF